MSTQVLVALRSGESMSRVTTQRCSRDNLQCKQTFERANPIGMRRTCYYSKKNPSAAIEYKARKYNVAAIFFWVLFLVPIVVWLVMVLMLLVLAARRMIRDATDKRPPSSLSDIGRPTPAGMPMTSYSPTQSSTGQPVSSVSQPYAAPAPYTPVFNNKDVRYEPTPSAPPASKGANAAELPSYDAVVAQPQPAAAGWPQSQPPAATFDWPQPQPQPASAGWPQPQPASAGWPPPQPQPAATGWSQSQPQAQPAWGTR